MTFSLSPTTGVVVTGGASGLGRETCLALAEAGRPVAVWDVQAEQAATTAKECADRFGVIAHAQTIDLRDDAALPAAAEETLEALPSVGGFVHAAGVMLVAPFGAIDDENWTTTMDVNLRAFVTAGQLLLPALRAACPGSAIVAVASTEALRGQPLIPAYAASKHAVVGLVKSLARSLGPEIRVNAVCPGFMDTPMLAKSMAEVPEEVVQQSLQAVPLARFSHPAEVARVIRFLLGDEASYVSGAAIPVDGGMLA